MKKDKSGKSEPEFNNNPFRSLRSFKPKPAPAPAPKPDPARKETKEEEGELFLRAMAGARKIDGEREEPAEVKKGGQAPYSKPGGPDEQQVFLQAMKKIGTTLREAEWDAEEEGPRMSASSRMRQLRRGMIRIQDELDLHGCLRDEALAKLSQFMNQACLRGLRAVLVITGKGINSTEGPVLQGAVADWLRGKGKGMTAEFGPAPRDKGGSGAFVVFLKKR